MRELDRAYGRHGQQEGGRGSEPGWSRVDRTQQGPAVWFTRVSPLTEETPVLGLMQQREALHTPKAPSWPLAEPVSDPHGLA